MKTSSYLAIPAFLCLVTLVHAQGTGRATTGNTGSTGASALGSSATGSAATGAAAASSAAAGGGNAAGGGQGAGASQNPVGSGGPQFGAADGSLGAQVGQNGFIGRSDNTGRVIGSQLAGQGSGSVQQNNFSALGGNRGGNTNQQQGGTQRLIRPRLRISFTAPPVPVETTQANLTQQLTSIPHPAAANIQVVLNAQGIATLSGDVQTEHERKLMEAIVRLEPGVRGITNNIVAAEPPVIAE